MAKEDVLTQERIIFADFLQGRVKKHILGIFKLKKY